MAINELGNVPFKISLGITGIEGKAKYVVLFGKRREGGFTRVHMHSTSCDLRRTALTKYYRTAVMYIRLELDGLHLN